MNNLCPIDLDTARLHREVTDMYTRVATAPDGEFHFHRGPEYAAARLGYDPQELAALPADVTARFAGIGNPHAIAPLPLDATVVDIGCGAGTDLLLTARRIGPAGRAIGVDMTPEMRAMASAGAAACGLGNVDVRDGNATALPLDDASVDVVMSNGVLNLVPDKLRALSEMRRVLRPGGRVQMADIVLGSELPDSARQDINLWTA
jgi:SAM-dependent methyltransferase